MPITADLQEKKRKLVSLREEQRLRFQKAHTAPESEKHGIVEEIKRLEPEILNLHNEVVEDEKLVIAEMQNEEELKALHEGNRPDRRTPFSVRDAANSPLGTSIDLSHMKSLGEMIAESEAVKTYLGGGGEKGRTKQRTVSMEFDNFKSLKDGLLNPRGIEQIEHALRNASDDEVKAILTTSGLTGYDRQPGIVLQGVQQPHVASLIPQGETTMPTIRYVREVSFTPAAETVAEGGLKPEASWDKLEVDAPVRKIAVRTTVTEEMMEDFPAFRDYLMLRLPFMVEIEEDDQLLNGDGTGTNLRGVYNTTGILLHQQGYDVDETTAVTGDTAIDAILRAATRVQAESFFEPTGIVLNPFKWMNMRLTRSGTGDDSGGANRGVYLLGNPNDPEQKSLWGYPVVKTTRTAVNTGAVAAWNLACMIFRRKGITTDMTNTDGDDWKYNRVSIRSEERLAFPIFRPQAICKVTFVGSR
jgi:HK97 family phage major capsid protein